MCAALTAANVFAGGPWAPNFDAAAASAKASHKLVMVDFYTDW